MKSLWALFLCTCLITCYLSLVVSAAFTVTPPTNDNEEVEARAAFKAFKLKFQKVYHSPEEEELRYTNFLANTRFLKQLQYQAKKIKHRDISHDSSLGEASGKGMQDEEKKVVEEEEFGVTPFFDLSHEEFDGLYLEAGRQYFTLRSQDQAMGDRSTSWESSSSSLFHTRYAHLGSSVENVSLPSSWDWREHGMVTPVKNQGSCGSCWAFSSIGNVEGQWAMNQHPLIRLSEQQLTACDTVDNGCEGGVMENAFKWLIVNNSGVVYTEDSYPYTAQNGTVDQCGENVTPVPGATIHGMTSIPEDEAIIESALVRMGPLAIAVDATVWMFYMGGILPICLPMTLNHGVLLVGYNNNGPVPYWIIKNSWGTQWGENGYIRIRKGVKECKMNEYVVSALVGRNPPPIPPTSTSPPPAPAASKYVEKMCLSSECSSLCIETSSYPVNQCVKAGSGSVLVKCTSDTAKQMFYKTEDCTGEFRVSSLILNQCIANRFTYSQSTCESVR